MIIAVRTTNPTTPTRISQRVETSAPSLPLDQNKSTLLNKTVFRLPKNTSNFTRRE